MALRMPLSARSGFRGDLDASNASNRAENSSDNQVEEVPYGPNGGKRRRKTFHGARAQDRRKIPSLSVANQAGSLNNPTSLLSSGHPNNSLCVSDIHISVPSVLAPPPPFSLFAPTHNDNHARPPKGSEYTDSDDTLCNDVNPHSVSSIDDKQASSNTLNESGGVLTQYPKFNNRSVNVEEPDIRETASIYLEHVVKRRKIDSHAVLMDEMNIKTAGVADVRTSLLGNSRNPINVEVMVGNETLDDNPEGIPEIHPKMEAVSPRIENDVPGRAGVHNCSTEGYEGTNIAPALERYISNHTEEWETRKAHWATCDFNSWVAGGDVITERFVKIFERVQESVESDSRVFQRVDAILQEHKLNVLDKRDEMLRQVKDTIVAGSSDILSTCSTNTLTAAPVDVVKK